MLKNCFFKFGSSAKKEQITTDESILGGKGKALAVMSNLKMPVPDGFTISTELCRYYYENNKQLPPNFDEEIDKYLSDLENVTGKNFGGENPLLLSVRSGAKASMPGMMDTILNIGINDKVLEFLAKDLGKHSYALDSYRRLLQAYGTLVLGIHSNLFDKITESYKDINSEKSLLQIVARFKDIILEKTGSDFPDDVRIQLKEGIIAVLESWMCERAQIYRRINNIPEDNGTAVTIQSMVFGNKGKNSATGVLFSRNPSTGENKLYGEYLPNAQGEDVVSGQYTPFDINSNPNKKAGMSLEDNMPEIYQELKSYSHILEKHHKEMQDIEFTIEDSKLYILQSRNGKKTAAASIKIAVDMVDEGILSKEEAILNIDPNSINQLLHARVNYSSKLPSPVSKGLPASPGAAVGKIVFSPYDAEEMSHHHKVILVRHETSPEDIKGMHVSEGLLTIRGGMTSHAAVVARGMGKPCVCGASGITINEIEKFIKIGDLVLNQGDVISIDGHTGNIFASEVDLVAPEFSPEFNIFINWVDEHRKLKVRANAENPSDAKTSLRLGAEGIGLCRTEHMFFREDKIALLREIIISPNIDQREAAIKKLLPIHKDDFKDVFRVMHGKPVNVRLIDPPLHEFLPQNNKDINALEEQLDIPAFVIDKRLNALHEVNPMMGHRGCRLGITFPEIYEMQIEAIFLAMKELKKENISIDLEIMIPLVSDILELKSIKSMIQRIATELDIDSDFQIGTMIELPRACLQAKEIGMNVDYFSFGTNDLTQTTYGISRDDVSSFLPEYISNKIYSHDPFVSLDKKGVGELLKIAIERGKDGNSDIKLGVCGEHGGDPNSIQFFHDNDLEYVSCSPYRVPVAKVAAARANILANRRKNGS